MNIGLLYFQGFEEQHGYGPFLCVEVICLSLIFFASMQCKAKLYHYGNL